VPIHPLLCDFDHLSVRHSLVQTAVVPIFLKSPSLYDSRRPPGDLCVSAPTGSGKTLAYVIPIVQVTFAWVRG
jgi:ATP-dependent RNA helicase DDX51/DBP6